jgi:hypothetical protein
MLNGAHATLLGSANQMRFARSEESGTALR